MSYCRVGEDSDVYVYRSGDEWICTHRTGDYVADSETKMFAHLTLHRRRGHKVPERALQRLRAEMAGLPYLTDVEVALHELVTEGETTQEIANEIRIARGLPALKNRNGE